jgi:hypothetical protein
MAAEEQLMHAPRTIVTIIKNKQLQSLLKQELTKRGNCNSIYGQPGRPTRNREIDGNLSAAKAK